MKVFREWSRRLARSERLHRSLCYAIGLYIRFVYRTNRWTHEGAEHTRRLAMTDSRLSAPSGMGG